MIKKLLRSSVDPIAERLSAIMGKSQHSLDTYPVRVLITGIEHSGTTLLSTLIKQDSSLNSGFECGFLLADKPFEFKHVHPWYEWMQEPVTSYQWGLSVDQLDHICASKNWEEAYNRLLRYSPVFNNEIRQQICDKTPRYLSCLDKVLDKLPDFVPCLVIEKKIENLWRSHKSRNGDLEGFCETFCKYYKGLRKALPRHANRIHRISYEELCTDLSIQLKEIFSVIDLPFQQEYIERHQKSIHDYFDKKYNKADALTEQEMSCLEKLKKEMADLAIR